MPNSSVACQHNAAASRLIAVALAELPAGSTLLGPVDSGMGPATVYQD